MSAPQVFLTETRERFLKAVIAELPAERIRELYLFAPIRQGGVESGIAVIAAELPESLGSESLGSELLGSESVGSESLGSESLGSESGDGCVVDPAAETPSEAGPGSDSADADTAYSDPAYSDPSYSDPNGGVTPDPLPPTPDPRYTVYTARYRHTQKGPERGKWESSIVAEADAPLLSIETVVRGVQRRSGDVDPPDHMSGDEVRSALRITPPANDA